jgi:hypothetical protein
VRRHLRQLQRLEIALRSSNIEPAIPAPRDKNPQPAPPLRSSPPPAPNALIETDDGSGLRSDGYSRGYSKDKLVNRVELCLTPRFIPGPFLATNYSA